MADTLKLWNHIPDWRSHRRTLDARTIGFVPTMGALHRGHAALVERCRAENDVAVVSIFVNPSQFNDPHDLERYPRTLTIDLELLERLGVDHVLHPSVSELYPNGYRFRIEANRQTQIMEAAARPGFLQGVMTVVLKLLNLVNPRRAYFGEKDYQQLKTLAEMVDDFFLPTEIVACPTVRDPSGFAESSRNALLSPEARCHAPLLFRTLTTAASPEEAAKLLQAGGFAVDYVEEHWGRRFAAVFLEGVRLIDNVSLTPEAR
jgi:pantoate--beta-alanine ligase